MISQTQTTNQTLIHLEVPKQEEKQAKKQKQKQKQRKSVQWTEDTVDNENMGKLKSKSCCIYHKKHEESSDSDKTCSSDDEVNAIERDRCHKAKHREKCSKRKQKQK